MLFCCMCWRLRWAGSRAVRAYYPRLVLLGALFIFTFELVSCAFRISLVTSTFVAGLPLPCRSLLDGSAAVRLLLRSLRLLVR